jgi:hypothetical protein
MPLDIVNNGDAGLVARDKINAAIGAINGGLLTGATGPQGNTGLQGQIGATGATGADGVFVAGLLVYQTGSINGGSFSGAPLVYTASFIGTFTASYNVTIDSNDQRFWTISSKTSSGFIISSNGVGSIDNPVNWSAIETGNTTLGAFIGSQGPQGIQGDTGADGVQGIQGIQGNTGSQGATGSQGTNNEQYSYLITKVTTSTSSLTTASDLSFPIEAGRLYDYKYKISWSQDGRYTGGDNFDAPNFNFAVHCETLGTMSGIFTGVDSLGNSIGSFPFYQSSAYLAGTQSSYNYTWQTNQVQSVVSGFVVIEGILIPENDSVLDFRFSCGYNNQLGNQHTYGVVTLEPSSFGILKTIR